MRNHEAGLNVNWNKVLSSRASDYYGFCSFLFFPIFPSTHHALWKNKIKDKTKNDP